MQGFVDRMKAKFNDSQLEALSNVIKMKSEDFLLIQGPVSFILTNLKLAWDREDSYNPRHYQHACRS